jgi:TonB family protein
MKDYKKMYGIYLRSSMVVSLVLVACAFIFVPTIHVTPYSGRINDGDRIIDFFPPVDNPDRPTPPRPDRPHPVINDGDSDGDSVVTTITPTDFNYIPTPQDYHKIEIVPYYAAQIKPYPLYTPSPEYPTLVRQAGIEGTCIVEAVIDTSGLVREVKVYKSSGNSLLDEAALMAFRTYRFSPAYARDRAVSVWVRMPVAFKLK